jgi:hypothetical protein
MNQQYAHLAGLMLGRALGAEVLLTPAVCRSSFGTRAGSSNISLAFSVEPGARVQYYDFSLGQHLPARRLPSMDPLAWRAPWLFMGAAVGWYPSECRHWPPAAVTGGATWRAVPLDTVLNVAYLQRYWRQQGFLLHQVRSAGWVP